MSSKTPRLDPNKKFTVRELQNLKAVHAVCSKKIMDKLISELLAVRESEECNEEQEKVLKELSEKNMLTCLVDSSIVSCSQLGVDPVIHLNQCIEKSDVEFAVWKIERLVKNPIVPIQHEVFFDKRPTKSKTLDVLDYLDSDGYFKWCNQDDPNERPIIKYDLKNGKISFGSYKDIIKMIGEKIIVNGFWYKIGTAEYKITFGIPFEKQESLKDVLSELEQLGIKRTQFVDIVWIAGLLTSTCVAIDIKKKEVVRSEIMTRAHFACMGLNVSRGVTFKFDETNQYEYITECEQFEHEHAEELKKYREEERLRELERKEKQRQKDQSTQPEEIGENTDK